MKSIILCEGKTDAILISYFLKHFGWEHSKKEIKDFPYDKNKDVLNGYKKKSEKDVRLLIWGCDGFDALNNKLKFIIQKLGSARNDQDEFKKIVIFCDSDQNTNLEIISIFQDWLNQYDLRLNQELKLGEWLTGYVIPIYTFSETSPPENYEIEILFIVLPPNSPGNLEVFLLQSLANQSDIDQELVEKTKELIDNIPKEPYLLKKRLEDKAQLGCVS